MVQIQKLAVKKYSGFSHLLYWTISKYKIKFSGKKQKKILISDFNGLNWKQNLEEGFKNTNHYFEFNKFTKENIKNYDCVVPITIEDLIFTDNVRHLIPNNPIPIPTKESVQLCDDKIRFNSKLRKTRFKDYIPPMGITGSYPFILKKKVDFSGQNCHIIQNESQEKKFRKQIENPDYFTQKIITGKSEYATHILFKEGKIVTSLNIKYEFEKEMPIKGKDKQIYTRITSCPYLGLFGEILNTIGFQGMCCVNYKVQNNKPMIIEINPRVGYSLSRYLFSFVDRAM